MMVEDYKLLESMLDNMSAGIYVLDKDGTYIFANKASVNPGTAKSSILGTNVHDLLKNGVVDVCISDIVREKKHAVTMVQQVNASDGRSYKQIITSTPIFDANGEIQYFFTELYNLSRLNWRYQQALLNEHIQQMSIPRTSEKVPVQHIISESKAMRELLAMAKKVCDVEMPVLICGESGTGKEVVAQYIHEESTRRAHEMVVINCASLPENLLEAELFGYEKGSFTGALQTGKKGMIEEADGSTLFLDEVNSMPLSIQGKLLRVLETRKVQRIGSNKAKFVDFRLVAATNRDLLKCVEDGTFRLDLYYRLNVIPLTLPPLRDRPEDIVPLATFFLQQYCEWYGKMKTFSKEVFAMMLQHEWPGNVRELKNFVERVIIMSAEDVLTVQEVPESLFPGKQRPVTQRLQEEETLPLPNRVSIDFDAEGFDLKAYLAACEKAVLEAVLRHCGSTYKAGKFLGMDQSSVARKKQKYRIDY